MWPACFQPSVRGCAGTRGGPPLCFRKGCPRRRRAWLAAALQSVLLLPMCFEPAAGPAVSDPGQERIEFARDIQPILSERCYACHGPEKQENDLRWDNRSSALKGGSSGPAIIPGKSADSRMIRLV